MSWESTVTYYQVINELVKERLGGLHSAKILLYSIDFAPLARWQEQDDWDRAGEEMAEIAQRLEQAGADFIVIGANTMHKVAPAVRERINIPVLHIAEATVEVLRSHGISDVLLLGTRYTMTEDFYRDGLREAGLTVRIPDETDVEIVNGIIYDELCRGIVKPESEEAILSIIEKHRAQGAKGVILGCTELGLLVKQEHCALPLFDTAIIHAQQAAEWALDGCRGVRVNGMDINYYEAGEGKPIILVHGNGESHESFGVLAEQLVSAGYHVYAPDSRGHGGSSPSEEYHYADMAEDIRKFIEALGLEKPAYYGFSDGGILGLMLESTHPGTLSVMAVSGANLSPEGLTDEFMADIAPYDDPLCRLMKTEPSIDPDSLKNIKIPVLVTAGTYDVVRPEETERIAALLPDAELFIAEGYDHGGYVENNPYIGELLLAFLQERGY